MTIHLHTQQETDTVLVLVQKICAQVYEPMAEKAREFRYRDIKLYKSESLGSGAYGGVCKAKCDGVLCAAKIMHPTLFDQQDPGASTYLSNFYRECQLLSSARHPNIVQYLGVSIDSDTELPVLLMELCDENLTVFLERSTQPILYHIQLNISHDIALALVYLHSNGLIHRDLTGNNVLIVAGTRAKITDFGMSKLVSGNPRMTALTTCPGNMLYMAPEALDEAKSYTSKLDIFSFGVIVVQILTTKFPNPTNRFRLVSVPDFEEQLMQIVPETQRREADLNSISDAHPLKNVALTCLKQKEEERPSAIEVSVMLSQLKQSPQYKESAHYKTIEQKQGRDQPTATTLERPARSEREIARMRWREGKRAPEGMCRGSAAVNGDTAYFRPASSRKVYSYKHTLEKWSLLSLNPYESCSLIVTDGLLTSVGGWDEGFAGSLLSLVDKGKGKEWIEVFPPMPTPRRSTACFATDKALVAVGGFGVGGDLDTVEVMDTHTKQWSKCCSLPQRYSQLSGTVNGNTLYLAGGYCSGLPTKCVLACSLPNLYTTCGDTHKPEQQGNIAQTLNIWKEIGSLPVAYSTLATFRGDLLAIGGEDAPLISTHVYRYNLLENTWNIVSRIREEKTSWCFALPISENQLLVVGGFSETSLATCNVNILL